MPAPFSIRPEALSHDRVVDYAGEAEMGEDPPVSEGSLLGRAKRLVDDAVTYARSDEAKVKLAEAKKKAVGLGAAASAGAKDLLKRTGEATSQAKGKIEEIATSDRAGKIRSEAEGLWGRSNGFEVRGVPWMQSPIAIGVLLICLWPLGLWLLWRHPSWPRPKKLAWGGVWAGLMVLGFIAQSQDKKTATVASFDAGLAPIQSVRPPEKPSQSSANRTIAATKIADLAEADASELTPGNILAVLESMASQIEAFDVRAIDYTHGPKGEAIISRPGRDPQTHKATTDSGYLAADGKFRLHGLRTSWYGSALPGGGRKKFQEIPYFDGLAHGTVRNWYEAGERQSEMTMRQGKRHGVAISYFRDGTVMHVSLWEDGKADGPQCDWYSTGKIKSLKNYRKSAANGVEKSWHRDGKPESLGHYSDGRLDSELDEWSPKGKLVKTLWRRGEVRFAPGASNKRAFYFKLIDVADLHDPDSTNFEFKSPIEFIGVFGRPEQGSLDFDPEASDPASPRNWSYRCSDGTLSLRVVYIVPQSSFHVLIDPSATME